MRLHWPFSLFFRKSMLYICRERKGVVDPKTAAFYVLLIWEGMSWLGLDLDRSMLTRTGAYAMLKKHCKSHAKEIVTTTIMERKGYSNQFDIYYVAVRSTVRWCRKWGVRKEDRQHSERKIKRDYLGSWMNKGKA